MKRQLISTIIWAIPFVGFGQNIFPSTGNAGINRLDPQVPLHIQSTVGDSRPGGINSPTIPVLRFGRYGTAYHSFSESAEFRIGHGSDGLSGSRLDLFINGATNQNDIPDQYVMSWLYNGRVGVGTTNPQAPLHLSTGPANINSASTIDPNSLVIEAKTSGRLEDQGAALEFVIPANIDGTNQWSQGRIMTVAGNTLNGNATGKMILGTRRAFFERPGVWFYGNDLVIDGAGNIGIGTTTPKEKLSVDGNIGAREIQVRATGWPDYVFKPEYHLPSLSEIEKHIIADGHLPEMPSAKEVETNGLVVGEMLKLQQQKIEELTLHLIQKDKEIKSLNYALEKQGKLLTEILNKLK